MADDFRDFGVVKSKGQLRREAAEAQGMQRALAMMANPSTTPQAPALSGVGSLLSILQMLGGTSDLNQHRTRPPRPNQATRLRRGGTTPGAVLFDSSMPTAGYCEMCKTPHSNPNCRECRTGCGGRVIPTKHAPNHLGRIAPGQPAQRTNATQLLRPAPTTPSVGVGGSLVEDASPTRRVIRPNLIAPPAQEAKPEDDSMEVDSVAAKRLCPPNRKVNQAFSYLEALTSASTSEQRADGVDNPVDAKPSSSKIHALEQQLAHMASSGIDNPEVSTLLNKQLEAAKAEHTSAVAAAVPLTEDKYTEHKLAFQKYNTWAKAFLEARTTELDKEIARLQSERQLVVDEQAEFVGFYNNAMTKLDQAAKAGNVPTHVAASAAPAAVGRSLPAAELAQNVQAELSKQKEALDQRFQAEIQGQQLTHEQLLKRALDYGFGLAASSAVSQLASGGPVTIQPAGSAAPPAKVPAPAAQQ